MYHSDSQHALNEQIVQPHNAADIGVRISVGPPRVVMLSPVGDNPWGLFMFPNVWRLRDGRVLCAVTIGNDEMPSNADYHYLWYISSDEGNNWTHAVVTIEEAEEFFRERVTFAGGRQIYYKPKMVSIDSFDVKPVEVHLGAIIKGIRVFYRLGDLPEECRCISMYVRQPDEARWSVSKASMDPDTVVPAFKETVIGKDQGLEPTHSLIATRLRKLVEYVGDDRLASLGMGQNDPPLTRAGDLKGLNVHNASSGVSLEDIASSGSPDAVIRLLIPSPTSTGLHGQSCRPIQQLADGTLICTSIGIHPANAMRVIRPDGGLDTEDFSNIFRSLDGGRCWSYYSSIPYSKIGRYHISHAHIIPDMPGGNWIAMLRTYGDKTPNSPLCIIRSADQGLTWSEPVAIRPSSVNPISGLLSNGIAFSMYGRPGQFITFCADGEGKQWGNDVTLVSAWKDSEPEMSCCNSSICVLGPDRFLVAYSTYGHHDVRGRQARAIIVQEITVQPGKA